jgi:hypothetical protein
MSSFTDIGSVFILDNKLNEYRAKILISRSQPNEEPYYQVIHYMGPYTEYFVKKTKEGWKEIAIKEVAIEQYVIDATGEAIEDLEKRKA